MILELCNTYYVGAKKSKSLSVGRPRRAKEKRERSSYTLPPSQILWLREEAARYGVSRSELLEQVIHHSRFSKQYYGVNPYFSAALPRAQIANVCRQHSVKCLRLFGSRLRGVHGASSDLDLLVEFQDTRTADLFHLAALQKALQDVMGDIVVDLKTPDDLSEYFREEVLSESALLYREPPDA